MYHDSDGSARHDDEFIMSEGLHAVHGNLNPLSRAAEAALEAHRLQGHVPYDPRCTICARGKVNLSTSTPSRRRS